MTNTMLSSNQVKREAHMHKCGLDAYARTAEEWLAVAVAAEDRGHGIHQGDCETAMDIRNELSLIAHSQAEALM